MSGGQGTTHKEYKRRFLKAEEAQHSQWGEVDVFRRFGKTERRYGFLPLEHASFNDFNYAQLRGFIDGNSSKPD